MIDESGSGAAPKGESKAPPKKTRHWAVRWAIRAAIAFFSPIIAYLLILLVGFIPVNNDFEPTPDGIEILFTSSPVHADVVMPLKTDIYDWRHDFPESTFAGSTGTYTHVAIGWGDKGFFLKTPAWDDLTFSTGFNALFLPSDTCMHVMMTSPLYLNQEDTRSVKISREQYQALVDYVNATFTHDDAGKKMQLEEFHYFTNDAFFEAEGSCNCIGTCNAWVSWAMQEAGIRTPLLTPLPKTMFWYLPQE